LKKSLDLQKIFSILFYLQKLKRKIEHLNLLTKTYN
jgi:hypothetical protein